MFKLFRGGGSQFDRVSPIESRVKLANKLTNEFLATFSLCFLFNSEEVIFDNYGYFGMFLAVTIHMSIFQLRNNGAPMNQLLYVEEALAKKTSDAPRALCALWFHILEALASDSYSDFIWFIIEKATGLKVERRPCYFVHTVPVNAIFVAEFAGAFLLRFLLSRTVNRSFLATPLVYASFFTAAITLARCSRCWSADTIVALLYHLLAAIPGWLTASLIEPTPLKTMWRECHEGEERTRKEQRFRQLLRQLHLILLERHHEEMLRRIEEQRERMRQGERRRHENDNPRRRDRRGNYIGLYRINMRKMSRRRNRQNSRGNYQLPHRGR
ncbi:hypothetical protein GCK72_004775 [Caenorhabditis remanei]|uniref:Uncharacterized protein n=1 Tax=Caenorhabditis remanei TaxID=31234 RepID=A0A6A5HC30_CAERE|nr:hypothetical protein GCK72_004775 [Caenorhabditis remanei]KAF1764825.1 hypothetical protein GCK72_004775 [Caenorhabditis remanei]